MFYEILKGSKNVPVGFSKFSPNSKFVLQSLLNNTINLWDYIKGKVKFKLLFEFKKVVKTYSGHENEKNALICGFSGHKVSYYLH